VQSGTSGLKPGAPKYDVSHNDFLITTISQASLGNWGTIIYWPGEIDAFLRN
jgi:hypothetical protein